MHFPSFLAFVALCGCSSGFALNGVLLVLIFLTPLRVWWLFGGLASHSGFLGILIDPSDSCCCSEVDSELPVVLVHNLLSACSVTFPLFCSPVCVTVESTYQPLGLKHVTLLLRLLFSDYGVVLETCFSFCACSISFPPERSESCTDCHRIHLYNSPDAKLNQLLQHWFLLKSLSLHIAALESSSFTI